VKAFLGQTDLAIEHVARAMRLSPLGPLMFLMQTVALASGGLPMLPETPKEGRLLSIERSHSIRT
jgi:hypothetical protein